MCTVLFSSTYLKETARILSGTWASPWMSVTCNTTPHISAPKGSVYRGVTMGEWVSKSRVRTYKEQDRRDDSRESRSSGGRGVFAADSLTGQGRAAWLDVLWPQRLCVQRSELLLLLRVHGGILHLPLLMSLTGVLCRLLLLRAGHICQQSAHTQSWLFAGQSLRVGVLLVRDSTTD